jgi:hypothetical protein
MGINFGEAFFIKLFFLESKFGLGFYWKLDNFVLFIRISSGFAVKKSIELLLSLFESIVLVQS